mmetsp:Transcript_49305/g.123262  ORF Transcript_49305/g.123262 Transcript_49305/m.123262 type:complete len:218 (+) Transcript_49305:723-1376(+)
MRLANHPFLPLSVLVVSCPVRLLPVAAPPTLLAVVVPLTGYTGCTPHPSVSFPWLGLFSGERAEGMPSPEGGTRPLGDGAKGPWRERAGTVEGREGVEATGPSGCQGWNPIAAATPCLGVLGARRSCFCCTESRAGAAARGSVGRTLSFGGPERAAVEAPLPKSIPKRPPPSLVFWAAFLPSLVPRSLLSGGDCWPAPPPAPPPPGTTTRGCSALLA